MIIQVHTYSKHCHCYKDYEYLYLPKDGRWEYMPYLGCNYFKSIREILMHLYKLYPKMREIFKRNQEMVEIGWYYIREDRFFRFKIKYQMLNKRLKTKK